MYLHICNSATFNRKNNIKVTLKSTTTLKYVYTKSWWNIFKGVKNSSKSIEMSKTILNQFNYMIGANINTFCNKAMCQSVQSIAAIFSMIEIKQKSNLLRRTSWTTKLCVIVYLIYWCVEMTFDLPDIVNPRVASKP